MSIAVVTDSTADIPTEMARQSGLNIVAARVRFGETEYRDGIDISADEFYARLQTDSDTFPTTSQPPIGDFHAEFERLLKENDSIVSVHISSVLSGTYASATQGAELADPSGERIISIDTESASMTTGWVALAVKDAVDQGATLEEAAEIGREMVNKVAFAGTLQTLEYLKRGGRLSSVQAFVGGLLRFKPIIGIIDSKVEIIGKPRSHRKALSIMRQAVEERAPLTNLAILYTTTEDEAEELLQEMKHLVAPDGKAIITQLGPAIGAHIGPGTIGMAYSW